MVSDKEYISELLNKKGIIFTVNSASESDIFNLHFSNPDVKMLLGFEEGRITDLTIEPNFFEFAYVDEGFQSKDLIRIAEGLLNGNYKVIVAGLPGFRRVGVALQLADGDVLESKKISLTKSQRQQLQDKEMFC